jgi:MoxR-like ATPase
MQTHDVQRPLHNPREVLAQAGAPAVAALLRRSGYVIPPAMLRDLCHVLRTGLPWLIEGPRGGGKTALAESLAQACNLPLFYLQGMTGLTLADVLYAWDTAAQTQMVRQALAAGASLAAAQARQWSREFLTLGEALAAYEWAGQRAEVPVLICDEFDKLSEQLEDMLLQLFARGVAHVPRYGEIGVRDTPRWPIVILLSNDQRHDLSPPLRSRCLYSWLPAPTPPEEAAILHARCPTASRLLLGQMVKLLHAVRGLPGLVEKPGLRESLALLQALVASGTGELTTAVLREHLCFLAKRRSDLENLRQALVRVASELNAPAPDVDAWLSAAEEAACHEPNQD